DLNFLIRAIRFELGDGGLDSDHVNVGRVETLMSAYQSNKADWQQYAHFDKYKYTRNLVDDGNGQFNLLILAWGPGQKSPIHDHARSHCVMKVLDGSLIETQYHWPQILQHPYENPQQPLRIQKETHLKENSVAYIHDRIGLHRVGNSSDVCGSVSLHLYTPPIHFCHSFNESTGHARASTCQTFHSQYGVKNS
ncbi:RmlC-like cupin domain-containing protein, partial [Dimargaris cristalligena]